MAEETDAEYAARMGLEPPSDPEVAKIWWADFAFHARAQWPAEVAARLSTDGRGLTINRIAARSQPADANHMRR